MKARRNKKEGKSRNLSEVFTRMIAAFEDSNSTKLTVLDVSKKFRVQSRRVYDFFNVFGTLGVCNTENKSSISWVSMKKAMETIKQEYIKLEHEAQYKTISELFTLKQSQGLGSIGLSFLLLYFYLNTQVLNIHDVSALFLPMAYDRKSLERRLYLVLSMFDLVGFVKHSQRTGDYTILIDMKPIINEGMKSIQNECKTPCSILSLLSKVSEPYMEHIFEARRQQFTSVITEEPKIESPKV